MNEIEIKLRVGSFDGIRERLSELGFVMKNKDVEKTSFFDEASGRLKSGDITVRIKEGSGWSAFAVKKKRHDDNYKIAEEYETDISDPKAMTEALAALGLESKFEYSKEREHWTDGRSSVEVDHIPEIGGLFVEVEAETADKIEEIIKALGLQEAERDKRSYPDIIREFRAGRQA